jgi:deoxyribonuclease-4
VRLGAHVSVAGGMVHGVRQGLALGCEAVQVFTRNQRQWSPRPLDPADAAAFRLEARAAGYLGTAVSHASYLINAAAPDGATRRRSRAALLDEILRCAALGIPFLCLHPGAHLGAGEARGLDAAAAMVREALGATRGRRVTVLLENTAGQGTALGWRLEHLGELLRSIGGRRAGVCLDTCHLFAAGYDLRGPRALERTIAAIDEAVGLSRVRAFHLNDSRLGLASRRDRHAHIGEGAIGAAAFGRLVRDPRFARLPGILETPGGPAGYGRNLARLRRMRRP